MTSNYRNIIDENFVKLCDLTNCTKKFLDTCNERGLITRDDKDQIEKEKIQYNRNRLFYKTVWFKDEEKFQKLVEIMKEEDTSQSGDVLNILESINQSGPSSPKCPRHPQNPVEREEKIVWFNVQDSITSFVGREKELKELHEIVTRNADKDTEVAVMSQLTSVSGMGGIGKTTLAREYVKRYASFFNKNIIWINAETTSTTEESFRGLLEKIGVQNVTIGKQNEKDVPISKVTAYTYELLSRRKCLFVFDNVEEYKSTVGPFIPKSYEPGKIRPYILITSRKQRLVEDCKVLRLDILAIEDAQEFIKSKLQEGIGQIDDASVLKLANELECLPLALQQAVAYIQMQIRLKLFFPGKETNHIEEYLKLLEENPAVPLNHEYQDETMDDYAYTVMRTWDVTLKAIEREKHGSQTIKIFEMLSYFPPEKVDIQAFDSLFSKEEIQHSCVILEQYSFINRVWEYINIHRLVQQVIQVQNKEKNREEYLLGRCLSLAENDTKMYHKNNMYWNIWKHSLRYETLVIKFRSVLGKIYMFRSMKDLEILNSSLEILERNLTQHDLVDLYYKCVNSTSTLVQRMVLCGDVPDWLVQTAKTRLNALVEMEHIDSMYNIFMHAANIVKLYSVAQIPEFIRDVVLVTGKYFYEHSPEALQRLKVKHYNYVQFWLKSQVPWQDFHIFHLLNESLLKLVTITDNDREFMRGLLDSSYSLPLDAQEIERLDKVDVLLSNILCLLLLKDNSADEILCNVFKISVQMRKTLTEIKADKSLWAYIQRRFARTLEVITLTLNNVVIIGTAPLINSEWALYVKKVIYFVGTYEKILDIGFHAEESLNAWLPELESTICELEDCCRQFADTSENVSLRFRCDSGAE